METKYKFLEFDEQQSIKDFGFNFLSSKEPPKYIDVLEWKHAKDKAIMLKLLEIIEIGVCKCVL